MDTMLQPWAGMAMTCLAWMCNYCRNSDEGLLHRRLTIKSVVGQLYQLHKLGSESSDCSQERVQDAELDVRIHG